MYIAGLSDAEKRHAHTLLVRANTLWTELRAMHRDHPRHDDLQCQCLEASEWAQRVSGHYRLNERGMIRVCEVMALTNALDRRTTPGDGPHPAAFGLRTVPSADHQWPQGSAERRFLSADRAWRSTPSAEGRIPVFKLASSHGWLVLPSEIKGSLHGLPHDVPSLDWWSSWMSYLQRAAARGGFRIRRSRPQPAHASPATAPMITSHSSTFGENTWGTGRASS